MDYNMEMMGRPIPEYLTTFAPATRIQMGICLLVCLGIIIWLFWIDSKGRQEEKEMIEIKSVRDLTPEEKAEWEKKQPVNQGKPLDRLPIEIVSIRDIDEKRTEVTLICNR